MRKILRKADVFVQNLAPGATERMGLGWERLRHVPGLVVCDISGYGSTGPYRDKKAYDLLIQGMFSFPPFHKLTANFISTAESGFLSITGSPNNPAKAGASIADIAAGTTAFQSILTALLHRHKTGKGTHLDISMLESLAEWMSFPLYYAYDGAPPLPLAGAEHASIYPYGPFQTGDGEVVMLGMQNEREWKIFCEEILENGELVRDAKFVDTAERSKNRKELKAIIEAKFEGFGADEALGKLQKAGIANAKMNDMQDVWEHPQLKARERWTEVETPNGVIPALKPAGHGEGWEVRMDPIPAVGEHTEAILKEFEIER